MYNCRLCGFKTTDKEEFRRHIIGCVKTFEGDCNGNKKYQTTFVYAKKTLVVGMYYVEYVWNICNIIVPVICNQKLIL